MGTRARCLAALAFVTATSGALTGTAHASCLGPQLTVSPATAPAGGVVRIDGEAFGTACNDVVDPSAGSQAPLGRPDTRISISFEQGELRTPLAVVDADGDYRFSIQVRIPSSAVDGTARIVRPERLETSPADLEIVGRVGAPTTAADSADVTVLRGHLTGTPTGDGTGGGAGAKVGGRPWIPVLAGVVIVVVLGGGLAVSRRHQVRDLLQSRRST